MAELWQYLFFLGSPEGGLLVERMERATLHVPRSPKDQAFGDNDEGEKSGDRLPFGEAAICPRFRNDSGKGMYPTAQQTTQTDQSPAPTIIGDCP